MTKQKRKTCYHCKRKLVVSKMKEFQHREKGWNFSGRDMSIWICKKCPFSWRG